MLKNTILSLVRFLMSPNDGQGGGVGGTDEKYPEPEPEDVGDDDLEDDGEGEGKPGEPNPAGEGEADGKGKEGDKQPDKNGGDKQAKPKQDPATNAKMKALRLQREAEEKAKREAELAKARDEGLKEALGGVNPYTGEQIVDEVDLHVYRIMKSIKDKGGDPIADYAKESARLEREESKKRAEAQKAEQERKDNAKKEVERFSKEHPDVNLNELLEDPDFSSFAQQDDLIANVGLSVTYRLYLKTKAATEADNKAKRERADRRREHSPGSANGATGGDGDYYTAEELKKLSKAEIEKNLDKVLESQRRIARNNRK